MSCRTICKWTKEPELIRQGDHRRVPGSTVAASLRAVASTGFSVLLFAPADVSGSATVVDATVTPAPTASASTQLCRSARQQTQRAPS